jgi:hypothetical protein
MAATCCMIGVCGPAPCWQRRYCSRCMVPDQLQKQPLPQCDSQLAAVCSAVSSTASRQLWGGPCVRVLQAVKQKKHACTGIDVCMQRLCVVCSIPLYMQCLYGCIAWVCTCGVSVVLSDTGPAQQAAAVVLESMLSIRGTTDVTCGSAAARSTYLLLHGATWKKLHFVGLCQVFSCVVVCASRAIMFLGTHRV